MNQPGYQLYPKRPRQKRYKWKVNSPYGDIDITINLSNQRKDPKSDRSSEKMQSKVLIQSVSFAWKMKDMQEE